MSRRTLAIAAVLVLALVAFVLATRGPAEPIANAPGTFSFAVLGDAPYYIWEDWQYRLVLRELDAHDLSWVIQVGDIFWRPCDDQLYRRSLDWYNGLRHPVFYTPGDNEWSDCWEPGSGEYAPLERLERLRRMFFADPTHSIGGRRVAVESQASDREFATYVENVRWQHQGLVFATFHLVGGWNGLTRFPGRSERDDEAVAERTAAATAWLRETFAQAEAIDASAVILAFHADPGFENPPGHRYRRTYEPFIKTLEEEAERFARPVLLAHGDDHEFIVDQPLMRRTDGLNLANVTRLEVPGSPDVGWVHVTVTPGAEQPFAFRNRVIPRWKYW